MARTTVVSVVAVLAIGCGSGGSDDDASVDEAPASDTTAGGSGTADDQADDDQAAATAALDCDDAYQQLLVLNQQYDAAVRRGGTPDEPIDFEQVAAEVEEASATAPAPISDAYEQYAAAVLPFYAGLAAMDFDASDPGGNDAEAYVALTQELDATAVESAFAEIQTWLTGPCEDL